MYHQLVRQINKALGLDVCINNTNIDLRTVIQQIALLLQDIAFTTVGRSLANATQIDLSHLQQLSACPHLTNHLIACARQSDATQYYLHPKVYPREQCPIKLTCLLPSKSCYTNNVTQSNRLTGLQPSLEPRICAKNKHEKDSATRFMKLCETPTFQKVRIFQ